MAGDEPATMVTADWRTSRILQRDGASMGEGGDTARGRGLGPTHTVVLAAHWGGMDRRVGVGCSRAEWQSDKLRIKWTKYFTL